MKGLTSRSTCELNELPPCKKVVGYTWVFSILFLPDGSIE